MPRYRGGSKKKAYKTQGSRLQKMVGKPYRNIYSYPKLVNTVERLENAIGTPERKFNESATTAAYFITIGPPLGYGTVFMGNPTRIGQGTGQEERLGNKVMMADVTWKVTCGIAVSALLDDYIEYRLIAVVVKNSDAYKIGGATQANLVLIDYLSNPNSSPAISTLTMLNKDRSENFVILKDKTYVLDEFGTGILRTHKMFKRLQIETSYTEDGVNDPTFNEILFFIIPGTTVNNFFTAVSYWRANFTDC